MALVDAVDDLAAAIEDEILSRGRPLESDGIPEAAGDVRGDGVNGAQNIALKADSAGAMTTHHDSMKARRNLSFVLRPSWAFSCAATV